MVTRDLRGYAQAHWQTESVTEVAKSSPEKLFVESEKEIYNFDRISARIYQGCKNVNPTSADGLMFTKAGIELIEFKSGFQQRITKQNFNEEKGRCADAGKVCRRYWSLFFRNQETERRVLLNSIRTKAIESYITLEKELLPRCPPSEIHSSLRLLVVIDAESMESYEDTLAGLAGQPEAKDNPLSSVRQSLRRLLGRRDACGNPYLYDEISVLSVVDFQNYLRRLE